MSEIQDLIAIVGDDATAREVLKWVHARDADMVTKLGIEGDWLVEYAGVCTCGSGSAFPHEPYCGVDPIEDWTSKINAIRGETLEKAAKLFDERKPNGQVYQGYDVARELKERATVIRKEK